MDDPVLLPLAPVEQLQEDFLVEQLGPMLINISQDRATRGSNSQMFELPLTASKAAGDLAERTGAAQLAEEHGHKLAPTGKSSGMSFGSNFFHGLLELDSRKEL